MAYVNPDDLVSVAWLQDNLGGNGVKVLDCSWYLPPEGRNPRAEYEAEHIPGAVFCDIDAVADQSIPLPHMWPSKEIYDRELAALGLNNSDHIIVYDGWNSAPACRMWWMLKAFGHKKVSLLNGGMGAWKEAGGALASGPSPELPAGDISGRLQEESVRFLDDMLDLVAAGCATAQILDARPPGRFNATEPEPRPGMRGGHMPGALNLFVMNLLNRDGTIKDAAGLREAFTASGLDLDRPVVTTCGSGVTASLLLFGLHLLGATKLSLYDGSWSEWGSRQDTPITS